MISRLKTHGLPEPEFIQNQEFKVLITRPVFQDTPQDNTHVTPHVTPHVTESVKELILALTGEISREELQEKLNLKDREYFRKAYLNVAIEDGLVEMTIPDKPRSIHQKYHLTEKGKKQRSRNKEW